MTRSIPLRRRDPDFCPRDGTPMADMERAGEPVRMCPECGFWQGPDPLVMLGLWIERDGEVLLVQRGDTWTLPLYHMREAADPVKMLNLFFGDETSLKIEDPKVRDVFTIEDDRMGEALLFLYEGQLSSLVGQIKFHDRDSLSLISSSIATHSVVKHVRISEA